MQSFPHPAKHRKCLNFILNICCGYYICKTGKDTYVGSNRSALQGELRSGSTGVSVVAIMHGNSSCSVGQDTGANLQYGNRSLGIDSTGFFKLTDGVKTYF